MAAEAEIFAMIDRTDERHDTPDEPGQISGRPNKVDPVKLVAWRQGRDASISETARHWGVSVATVKRLSRVHAVAAAQERARCRLCLLYTSPSPRDGLLSRMPSSA